MSRCRSCDAQILWATTAAGKAIPLDAEPAELGNVKIYGREANLSAVTLAGNELRTAREDGVRLFMPHHATCPQGQSWRKR